MDAKTKDITSSLFAACTMLGPLLLAVLAWELRYVIAALVWILLLGIFASVVDKSKWKKQ